MESRIKKSAIIVTIGLVVALISLIMHHPLAFVLFLVFGALIIVIGMLYYLFSLAKGTDAATPQQPAT
jgi:hypothetical protein